MFSYNADGILKSATLPHPLLRHNAQGSCISNGYLVAIRSIVNCVHLIEGAFNGAVHVQVGGVLNDEQCNAEGSVDGTENLHEATIIENAQVF